MKVTLKMRWVTCSLPKLYGDVSETISKEEFDSLPLTYWERTLLERAARPRESVGNIKVKRMCVTYLESKPMSANSPNYKTTKSPKDIAKELSRTMQCNCDLDRWEPEQTTGHSWVCRIHKAVIMGEPNGS